MAIASGLYSVIIFPFRAEWLWVAGSHAILPINGLISALSETRETHPLGPDDMAMAGITMLRYLGPNGSKFRNPVGPMPWYG